MTYSKSNNDSSKGDHESRTCSIKKNRVLMGYPQFGLVVSMCFVLGIVLPAEFQVIPASQTVQVAVRSAEAAVIRHDGYQQPQPQIASKSKSTSSLFTGKSPSLQIAWLMSFPNSGTSYTSKLIRHISETRTASNYGNENKGAKGLSLPIFPDQPAGPFWQDPYIHPEYTLPKTFVLSTSIIPWSVNTSTTNEYKDLVVDAFVCAHPCVFSFYSMQRRRIAEAAVSCVRQTR
jgi:hypothetical protein